MEIDRRRFLLWTAGLATSTALGGGIQFAKRRFEQAEIDNLLNKDKTTIRGVISEYSSKLFSNPSMLSRYKENYFTWIHYNDFIYIAKSNSLPGLEKTPSGSIDELNMDFDFITNSNGSTKIALNYDNPADAYPQETRNPLSFTGELDYGHLSLHARFNTELFPWANAAKDLGIADIFEKPDVEARKKSYEKMKEVAGTIFKLPENAKRLPFSDYSGMQGFWVLNNKNVMIIFQPQLYEDIQVYITANPKNPYKKSWDIQTYEESARMWYEECLFNNKLRKELGEGKQLEPATEFYEKLAKEMGFRKPWFEKE